MYYRVLKAFKYRDIRGKVRVAKPGEPVDIVTERERVKLERSRRIGPIDLPPIITKTCPPPARASARTLRVGLFLYTSPHYSGGRIHLFQYAHAFAENGGEVFYCSNAIPAWRKDYPENGIRYVLWGNERPPEDLDLIMTDGKGPASAHALAYKKTHPKCRLCVMNFETPNWVAEFLPQLAKKISAGSKSAMLKADLLVANSRESARFLKKWLKKNVSVSVLPPAVNTYSVQHAMSAEPRRVKRPYAIWSGRGQDYKGHGSAVKAVWSLKTPLDLVSFGKPKESPKSTPLHEFRCMPQGSDDKKFALMRGASVTLAPSLFEGFGMVPAESLAVGTPVVAYDLPVLRQEYEGIRGLHLVPWNDRAAFAAKVLEVIRGPKEAVDREETLHRLGLPAMGRRIDELPLHAIKRVRVTAQMIAYWGFIPETIEAVYPYVHEILIAFGPDKNAARVDDGSLERIKALPDPDHKIRLCVREQWADKQNMRQWCHDNSTGNYNLVLDGDEIWVGLADWIKARMVQGCPRWVTLWHDAEHHVVGYPSWGKARWGKELQPFGCECNHYRWSWLRPSYRWAWHCRLEAQDKNPIRNLAGAAKVPSCQIYHLGHVLPSDVMRVKHRFYRSRDGDDAGRKKREASWHKWNGKTGDCGDGIVKKVDWDLPDIVRRGVESAKRIELRK